MKDQFLIPTILTSQELLDKAFKRATKVQVPDTSAFHRKRRTAAARVTSAGDVIIATLGKYIKAFPSFDNLHPYQREMIAIVLDVDQVRKSLGALKWAGETVGDVCRKSAVQITKTRNASFVESKRSEAYGRVSSIVHRIGSDLAGLGKARDILKVMPAVDPGLPTVVVAGVPNAGKSALVRCLSSAKPQVAQYPFTTKEVHVGYFDEGAVRYQVIDTPGLLDRGPDDRNDIEQRAAAALRHLGGLIVYLLDPSGTCGHGTEEQEGLLKRIMSEFPDSPLIVVETKADLVDSGSKRMKVSGETGRGAEKLRKAVIEELQADTELVDRQIMELMEEREDLER